MGVTVGIDLGTSNSCVAFHDGKQGWPIEMPSGARTLPSVVAWRDGERLVGEAARRHGAKAPEATIREVKRLMGEKYHEEENQGRLVFEGEDGFAAVLGGDDVLHSPAEVSAMILGELKRVADERLPDKVSGAVICHPAYFTADAKEATREAGRLAGFDKVELLSEPMAAAIAYGMTKEKFARVVVYDFGGGTFDVAVMDVGRGHNAGRSADGNMALGGADFDHRLAEDAMIAVRDKKGIDLTAVPFAREAIVIAAEQAKIALSGDPTAEIVATNVHTSAETGEVTHLNHRVSVEAFQAMTRDLVAQTIEITERALAKAGRSKNEIDDVILVGGMTRMPAVRQAVEAFFGKPALNRINPDEIVALGAAIKGAEIDGRLPNFEHQDIVARDLKIQVESGALVTLIEAGTTFPCDAEVLVGCHDPSTTHMDVRLYSTDRVTPDDSELTAHAQIARPTPDARWRLTVRVDGDGVESLSVNDPELPEPMAAE